MAETVLDVRDLVTRFHTSEGVVHAVNGVSFKLKAGETLGIVGESGCGKSVTILSILGLIPSVTGRVERGEAFFYGRDLLRLSERELRKVRGGQIGLVFQDPMTSLNPLMTIGKQVSEVMLEHMNITPRQARQRVVELVDILGIPDAKSCLDDYPHQFSGGMRQRVMIAIALACGPRLLIADEPTTALDVTIQAQIIARVRQLREEFGMSVIWITHDLGVVAGLVDWVIVMYGGQIVEYGDVWSLYALPKHPYTRGLLESLPQLNRPDRRRLANIEGRPPDLLAPPKLCPFLPRCKYAVEHCREEMPALLPVGENHLAACWVAAATDK